MTPETWTRFLDDAGPLPVSDREVVLQRPSPALGARVVAETELPRLRGYAGDVRVRLGGGATQVAGPGAYCAVLGLELTVIETALRDLDDPAGNARRVVAAVDAARDAGELAADVEVHVGVVADPSGPSAGWLAAADELGAAELALALPLDVGGDGLAAWIDAALDRELPFSLTGGTVGQAVDALRTTAALWGDADDLDAARRWCRSWTCPEVETALAHLHDLTA